MRQALQPCRKILDIFQLIILILDISITLEFKVDVDPIQTAEVGCRLFSFSRVHRNSILSLQNEDAEVPPSAHLCRLGPRLNKSPIGILRSVLLRQHTTSYHQIIISRDFPLRIIMTVRRLIFCDVLVIPISAPMEFEESRSYG